MKNTVTIALMFLGALRAFAWSPSVCNPSVMAKRAELQRRVRSAAPGTGLYSPRPYPVSDTDIVADFTAYVIRAYGRNEPNRGHFGVLADKLAAGAVDFAVVRVEDWTPARCADSDGGADSYYLLIVLDKVTRQEVARGTVHENGLPGTVAIPFPNTLPESVSASADRLNAGMRRRGIVAKGLQYIRTWGSLDCDTTKPCAAAKDAAGSIYISKDDRIFSLAERPVFSWRRDLRTQTQKMSLSTSLGQDYWMSVGGDVVMIARQMR